MRALAFSLIIAVTASPVVAQDVDAGEDVFRKCMGCHQIKDGTSHRTGPDLFGVVGRTAGSAEGFRYSGSMQAAGEAGLVWDTDNLFEYIQDPSGFLKTVLDDGSARARMSFRLTDAQDRRDVIAYLATFSDVEESGESSIPEGDGVVVAQGEPGVCVTNGSDHAHLFAAETDDQGRVLAQLDPGQALCAGGEQGGMVSVYEEVDGIEGCSRLVPAGGADTLIQYADFDRCAWGSNT